MKRMLGNFCLLASLLAGCAGSSGLSASDGTPAHQPPAEPPAPCSVSPPDSGTAEYTLRWMTSGTSLELADSELKAVLGRLQRSASPLAGLPKSKTFTVSYYEVAESDWPNRYKASLRQRLQQKNGAVETELTYKVRGPAPLPAAFPEVRACSGSQIGTAQETDIALALNPANNVCNAGISCSVDPRKISPLPAAFAPTSAARPCVITMTRYKLAGPASAAGETEDLKIEYWTFASRSGETRALIEISWKASLAAADEQAFRSAIAPLQEKLPAQPIPGKEQTALSCDANWAP